MIAARLRRVALPLSVVCLAGALGGCGEIGSILTGGQGQSQDTAAPAPSTEGAFPSWSPTTPSESGSPTTEGAGTTSGDGETTTATESPGLPSTPGTTDSASPSASTPAATTPAATPTTATPTTGAAPTVVGDTVQVDGRLLQGVPPGLGFPAGTKIEATNSYSPTSGNVAIAAPPEDALLTYYRALLPAAGYRVVADTSGTLTFVGKGFRGTLVGMGSSGAVLTWAPAAAR